MRIILLFLLAAVLAGCSDEPSEGAMREMVEAHTRRALRSTGQDGFVSFDSFRKQGCVAAKNTKGAYDCYYAATLSPGPGAKPITVNGKGRFRPTDKGLSFQDLGAQPR